MRAPAWGQPQTPPTTSTQAAPAPVPMTGPEREYAPCYGLRPPCFSSSRRLRFPVQHDRVLVKINHWNQTYNALASLWQRGNLECFPSNSHFLSPSWSWSWCCCASYALSRASGMLERPNRLLLRFHQPAETSSPSQAFATDTAILLKKTRFYPSGNRPADHGSEQQRSDVGYRKP